MFPPPGLLLPGRSLLVTDELAAPADFVLHGLLVTHMKDATNAKCVIISVSESFGRWKAIAAKSSVNLTQALVNESCFFVDVFTEVQPSASHDGPLLQPIYEAVVLTLDKISAGPPATVLVILDDITSLEWLGFPTVDIMRFSRAVRAACLKTQAMLITRHHILSPAEPDSLMRHHLQICSCHVEVKPLSSGRSGAVSGEIAIHKSPSSDNADEPLIPRSNAIQYRLTDAGAVYFAKGTGGGVL